MNKLTAAQVSPENFVTRLLMTSVRSSKAASEARKKQTFNLKSKVVHVMSSPVAEPFDRWGQATANFEFKWNKRIERAFIDPRPDRGNVLQTPQIWITALNKKSHIPELWLQWRSFVSHDPASSVQYLFPISLSTLNRLGSDVPTPAAETKSGRQSERCSRVKQDEEERNYRTRYCQTRFTAKPHGRLQTNNFQEESICERKVILHEFPKKRIKV